MTNQIKKIFKKNEIERKKILFRLILWILIISIFITNIASISVIKFDLYSNKNEITRLLIISSIFQIIIIVLLIHEYISNNIYAIRIFIFIFLIALFLSDTPENLVNGRSAYVFLIPIFLASFLYNAKAGIFISILTSIISLFISLFLIKDFPNIALILGYLIFSLITWKTAQNLEDTLFESVKHKYQTEINKNKYKLLFTKMNSGYAYCKSKYDKNNKAIDFKFIDLNEKYCEITNSKKELLSGNYAGQVKNWKNITKQWAPVLGNVALTGKELKVEQYLPSVNKWVFLKVYSPKKYYFVAIVDDITETKEMQNQLIKEKEKAETSEHEKEQFISTLSHEIRNPLNTITGLTELLEDTKQNAKQKQYINSLKSTQTKLLNIINNVLNISKIESKKIIFIEKPFKLRKVITDLEKIMPALIQKKPINYYFKVNKDIPQIIIGDEVKLHQILLNLLQNAVKFTNKGQIELKVLVLNSQKSTNTINLQFKIKDTGIGISQKNQKKIFNSFFQIQNQRKNLQIEPTGSGLGLTITQTLVEAMKGKIQVKSQLNIGTTFSINLPFKQINQIDNNLHKNNTSKTKHSLIHLKTQKNYSFKKIVKILLIEDSSINSYIIKKFLNNWNTKVHLFESAEKAIDHIQLNIKKKGENNSFIKKKLFDVILLDLYLMKMNGYEFAKYIKTHKNPRIHKIPIITLTGNIKKSSKIKAKNIGIDYYITKPFNSDKLFKTIKKAIK